MNTYHSTQRKEMTSLDADVPLVRPSLIRLTFSELRLLRTLSGRFRARQVFPCCAP